MKPRRLQLQAFGPYAHAVSIDFTALEGGGLFLIHGQTGAGKTSLLDGLSFALFGTASGSERSPDGLRSDFAASDLRTEASLEFSLGQDIYRATREPNQSLKKKRGEGLMSSKSDGRLEKYNPETGLWDLIATGTKKTDEAVTALLGMTEDQFRQVVVLPQGQFRKFLAAGSDDREDLLERLFRTGRYRRISEQLETRAKKAAAEFEQARTEREALLATLDVKDRADLQLKITELRESISAGSSGQQEIERKFNAARRELQEMRDHLKSQEELASAIMRRQALETRLPAHTDLTARLERHVKAQPVLHIDSRVTALRQDIEKLERELEASNTALPIEEARRAKSVASTASLESRRPEIEAAAARRESLQQIYKNVVSLKTETTQLATHQTTARELDANTVQQTERLALLKQERPHLELELARLTETASSIGRLKAEIDLVQKQIDDAQQAVRLAQTIEAQLTDLQSQNATLIQLDADIKTRVIAVKSLKLDYHRSQAARLASELKSEEPCPVCGSLDHPKPAQASTSMVTIEQIDAQETALETVQRRRAQIHSLIVSRQTEIQASTETLSRTVPDLALKFESELTLKTDRTSAVDIETNIALELLRNSALRASVLQLPKAALETLKNALTPLEQNLNEAQKAASAVSIARQALENNARAVEEAVETLNQAQEKSANARSLIASSSKAISQLEAMIPPDLRDLDVVKNEGLELKRKIEAYAEEAKATAQELDEATRSFTRVKSTIDTLTQQRDSKTLELKRAENELYQSLAQSSLGEIATARSAALTADRVVALEKERRDFDNEWASVQSRILELESTQDGLSPLAIDRETLAQREAVFVELDRERTAHAAEGLSQTDRLKSLGASEDKLGRLDERVIEIEKRHAIIGRLADAAAGRAPNLSRVGFQRYVLATRLDEVLEQASRRLFTMSRGQFVLKRASRLDDKRKNAGLDLEVEDALSGTTRPTASLSGGEGFLASLALALGLADVVQNHLGGVRLDAVFVDEGFGTLDPEALEQAMRTLTDLQAGGRMVGIISHVPELREQIAKRLVIKKSLEGSTVNWES